MANASYLKNQYYNYAYYVVPNLQSALGELTSIKTSIVNLSTNINKGYNIDGDMSVENYLSELSASVNTAYDTIYTALNNAVNRKNSLYYQWQSAERNG